MQKRQSRRLGWGHRYGSRNKARVFEALVPLACHQCGRPLEIGDQFRRGRRSIRLCWLCKPFRYPVWDSSEKINR